MEDLSKFIRSIPDFPKKGILFRDITPLLKDRRAFKRTIDALAKILKRGRPDYIVCAESRGFIFGGALSYKLGCGFIPVRKEGKLPYKIYKTSYTLEYGKETFEIHRDAIKKGSKVIILDDLLATGGTALALTRLVRKFGAKILCILFVIELAELKGRDKLKKYKLHSLIKF